MAFWVPEAAETVIAYVPAVVPAVPVCTGAGTAPQADNAQSVAAHIIAFRFLAGRQNKASRPKPSGVNQRIMFTALALGAVVVTFTMEPLTVQVPIGIEQVVAMVGVAENPTGVTVN